MLEQNFWSMKKSGQFQLGSTYISCFKLGQFALQVKVVIVPRADPWSTLKPFRSSPLHTLLSLCLRLRFCPRPPCLRKASGDFFLQRFEIGNRTFTFSYFWIEINCIFFSVNMWDITFHSRPCVVELNKYVYGKWRKHKLWRRRKKRFLFIFKVWEYSTLFFLPLYSHPQRPLCNTPSHFLGLMATLKTDFCPIWTDDQKR